MNRCVLLFSLLLVLLTVIFATVPLNSRQLQYNLLRASVTAHDLVYGERTEPSTEAYLLHAAMRMHPNFNDTSLTEPEQFRSRFNDLLTTMFPLPDTLAADRFDVSEPVNAEEHTLSVSGESKSLTAIQLHPQQTASNSVGQHVPRYVTVIYFHGGGFVEGTAANYKGPVGGILLELQAITTTFQEAMGSTSPIQYSVVIPDYRRAPEHPLPAAIEDCVDVYQHLLREQIDPKNIVFMGDSAGGHLAFSVALRARERGLPRPAAIVAYSPWTDLTLSGNSYRNNDDAVLQLHAVQMFARWAAPNVDDRRDYSLLNYSPDSLRTLPPVIIQAGGSEILLDDSVQFAKLLRQAGATVHVDIVPGMSHDFNLMVGWIPEATESLSRVVRFLLKQL